MNSTLTIQSIWNVIGLGGCIGLFLVYLFLAWILWQNGISESQDIRFLKRIYRLLGAIEWLGIAAAILSVLAVVLEMELRAIEGLIAFDFFILLALTISIKYRGWLRIKLSRPKR